MGTLRSYFKTKARYGDPTLPFSLPVWTIPVLAVLIFVAAPPAGARPAIFVTIENDFFVGRDEQYTSGSRIAWLSEDRSRDELPAWIRNTIRPHSLGRGHVHNYGFSVGQLIFTPSETRRHLPSKEDRPYAGYLFADAWLNSRTGRRLEIFTVQAGIVGPEAGGRLAQDTAHGFIGGQRPNGWDEQLKTEPVLQLGYDRRARFPLFRNNAEGRLDVAPHAGLGLGNLAVYANAGVTLRFRAGSDPTSWGASLPRPGSVRINSHPVGGFDPAARDFLIGVDGRAVARNLFLDGNSFRDSRSVDREPLVGDLFAGMEIGLRHAALTCLFVWRSREFETQERPHLFASISVALAF